MLQIIEEIAIGLNQVIGVADDGVAPHGPGEFGIAVLRDDLEFSAFVGDGDRVALEGPVEAVEECLSESCSSDRHICTLYYRLCTLSRGDLRIRDESSFGALKIHSTGVWPSFPADSAVDCGLNNMNWTVNWVDAAVLAVYLAGITAFGIWTGYRRHASSEQWLRADIRT